MPDIRAEELINAALAKIKEHNYDDALIYINRANDISPDEETQHLRSLITHLHDCDFDSCEHTPPNNGFFGEPHLYSPLAPPPPKPSQPTARRFTKHQMQMVRRIKRSRNFYEVLNVTHDATDEDIRKAYKRLALVLHPDKNNAPGAADAFKLLASAMTVLSDEQKRDWYDNSGANTTQFADNVCDLEPPMRDDAEDPYDNDNVWMEHIFTFFFGSVDDYVRPGYTPNNNRAHMGMFQGPRLTSGIVAAVIMITLVSIYLAPDPAYMFAPSSKFIIQRHTKVLGIPYYVKKTFNTDYRDSLDTLDKTIESDFVHIMTHHCARERSYRAAMMARARGIESNVYYIEAQSMRMPACENLSKVGVIRNSILTV